MTNSPADDLLKPDARIFLAGGSGLAGSAIRRVLEADGFTTIVAPRSAEIDLRDRAATFAAIRDAAPDVVILAAGKVGGIMANSSYPADFISENLQMQVNVMDSARSIGVNRLLFLGSSCIYPKFAEQPIREDSLMTGALEPTNDAYAIAKIAGVMQVQSVRKQDGLPWISAMPTNLFGPGDNFGHEHSHVLPALMRRFHDANEAGDPEVVLWGTGTPRREFLHSDDLGSAAVFLLRNYDDPVPINIGFGDDLPIQDLARMIAAAVGYRGAIVNDTSKPDGTPRKLLDSTRLRDLGWEPSIGLREGLDSTYSWFVEHIASARL